MVQKFVPLRVDFAGGWLDVPRFSRSDGYIVNCAISPTVSKKEWLYRKGAGLGGSGAWSILHGEDSIQSELNLGVGWQDPAVILETGACVWKSGKTPVLDFKNTGAFLKGKMAIYDTCVSHNTPELTKLKHDFNKIVQASHIAREAIISQDILLLVNAVQLSYEEQLNEGMQPLEPIDRSLASKYCGGGYGGYAVYLFLSNKDRESALQKNKNLYPIEPYCRSGEQNMPVQWQEFYVNRLKENNVF